MSIAMLRPLDPIGTPWIYWVEWPLTGGCFPAAMLRVESENNHYRGVIRHAMIKPDSIGGDELVLLGKRYAIEKDFDCTTIKQAEALLTCAKEVLKKINGDSDADTEALAKWWGEHPELFEAATGRKIAVDYYEKLKSRIAIKWGEWESDEFQHRFSKFTRTASRLEDLKASYPGEYDNVSDTNLKKICSKLGLSKAGAEAVTQTASYP